MRAKSQTVQVYNTLKPLKQEKLDYNDCIFECTVHKRKFLGLAVRYLYIFPNQVAISKEQRKEIPDRQIPINNDTKVSWTYKAMIKKDSLRSIKSVIFHVGQQEFEYLAEEKVMKDLKLQLALFVFQTKIQDEYIAEVIIDKGSYATVLELVNIYTKQSFAGKCIDQKKILEKLNAPLQLSYEIQTMRLLSAGGHPNILKLHELYIGNQNFYIVMELAQGGSLLSVMKKRETLFEREEIKIIMRQLLEGLAYMHSFDIMHRDLKPENLLFMQKDNLKTLKIADFGLAQSINEHPYVYPKCGTPGFVAPEVLDSNGDKDFYGYACDIFSAGVILYILLTGEPLFDSNDRKELLELNKKCQIDIDSFDPQYVDDDERDLLRCMLQRDPQKRHTALECLKHKLFLDGESQKSENKSDELFNIVESDLDVSQQNNIANFMKNKMQCFSKNPFIHLKNYDNKKPMTGKNPHGSMFISSNPRLDRQLVEQVYSKDEVVGSFGVYGGKLKFVLEEKK